MAQWIKVLAVEPDYLDSVTMNENMEGPKHTYTNTYTIYIFSELSKNSNSFVIPIKLSIDVFILDDVTFLTIKGYIIRAIPITIITSAIIFLNFVFILSSFFSFFLSTFKNIHHKNYCYNNETHNTNYNIYFSF